MAKKQNKQKEGLTDKRIEFYLDVCLKGTNDLRPVLKIDDNLYNSLHHRAVGASRSYFLYGALDEIEKAGTSLLRVAGFLDEQNPKLGDRISKNIIEAIQEEQTLWIRKLEEILTEVILFSKINEDAYYRHYMLVKELKSLKDAVTNSKDAYGCYIQNYQKQLDDISQEITGLEASKIDIQRCWYLAERKNKGRVSGIKGKLSSLSERINAAFLLATAEQIIALGISFDEGYESFSGAMHFNAITTRSHEVSVDIVQSNIAGIGVISANILIQVRKLLKDQRRKGYVAFLAKGFKNNDYAKELVAKRTRPNIKKGDMVNAQGELAEVTKVMKGRYGFRSFRVKFLLKQDTEVAGSGEHKTVWTHHNPDFEEYPAMWVRKLYSRDDLLSELRRGILEYDPEADVRTQTLTPHLRESIIHLWQNVGLKESVRGQRAAAAEKIQEEAARIKSGKLLG